MSGSADRSLRAAPTLIVTLKDGALSVPVPGSYPIVVDLPQLLVLEGFATATPRAVAPLLRDVAQRTGLAESDLGVFVQRLRDLGYLQPTPSPSPLGRPPAVAAATPRLEGRTVVVPSPCSALLADGTFALWDHAGRHGVALSAVELLALRAMTEPHTVADAHAAHAHLAGHAALSPAAFADLVARLSTGGFAVLSDDRAPAPQIFGNDGSLATTLSDQARRLKTVFARRAAEQDAAEAARAARAGRVRPRVVPVAFDPCPPLGLGLITAYARVYADGALEAFYDLRREWMWLEERVADNTARPAVYLFSNYLWSHAQCMQVSEQVKRLSPHSITIHGGPDTPKYPGDVEEYFRNHPSVDVTVRGEGEATAVAVLDALRAVIGQAPADLSVLADVAGHRVSATATASSARRTASASPISTRFPRRSSPACSTPTARCRARSAS